MAALYVAPIVVATTILPVATTEATRRWYDGAVIDAVAFDLDGVLVDSEPTWTAVRREFVLAHGGRWPEGSDRRMMGMATMEWAAYLHDELGVALPVDAIAEQVVAAMATRVADGPSLLPGAVEAVRRTATRWPLGLASSSPSDLIERTLVAAGLRESFRVTLSTEEVGAGKPAPDVYLEVARRLGIPAERWTAVEDSTNGLRAARAAGMRVVAVPTDSYPPDPDELARADAVIASLDELNEAVVDPSPD
jgi:beta-phosphoglucomutase-like phosphatase (HAD superfamily)